MFQKFPKRTSYDYPPEEAVYDVLPVPSRRYFPEQSAENGSSERPFMDNVGKQTPLYTEYRRMQYSKKEANDNREEYMNQKNVSARSALHVFTLAAATLPSLAANSEAADLARNTLPPVPADVRTAQVGAQYSGSIEAGSTFGNVVAGTVFLGFLAGVRALRSAAIRHARLALDGMAAPDLTRHSAEAANDGRAVTPAQTTGGDEYVKVMEQMAGADTRG